MWKLPRCDNGFSCEPCNASPFLPLNLVGLLQVIVEETKLFKVTVSFGNVNSLISLPCYMSHASIPAEVRAARGLPDDLVRISAGIEHSDDLIADLDQAMRKAMAKVGYQTPASASGLSFSAHELAGTGSGNDSNLLARIRQLEDMVKVLAGTGNGKNPLK